jgi:Ni2+-binding GTPase involved in maturation of urease and hydrogenase
MRHARQLKPGLPYLLVSAKTGDGLEAWYDWLKTGSNGRTAG